MKRIAHGMHLNVVLLNEMSVSLEQEIDKQNDWILVSNISIANSKGQIILKSAHSAWVMIWDKITSNDKILLIFVDSGIKIKQQNYLIIKFYFHRPKNTLEIKNGYSNKIQHQFTRQTRYKSGFKTMCLISSLERMISQFTRP